MLYPKDLVNLKTSTDVIHVVCIPDMKPLPLIGRVERAINDGTLLLRASRSLGVHDRKPQSVRES